MKKNLLLLVGVISIGLCCSYSIVGNGQEKSKSIDLKVEENDGVFIDSEDTKPVKKNRSVSSSRIVKIEKIFFEITDFTREATPVSMPKTNFSVSYTLNSKEVLLHKGKTNDAGEISNLSFPNIPNEVTTLNIRFYLGNDERGFVQRYNKKPYTFHHARAIPENSIINVSSSSARFGVSGNPDSYFYNYVAAKINHIFEKSVQEYSNNVAKANDLFPDTKPFEVAPINMNFEKDQMLDKSNGFNKNGHLGGGIPDIIIADRSDSSKFTDPVVLKRTVMHEWTHWNWYRYAYSPSGGYDGQYAYNSNPRVSYKEGWALFHANRYPYGYNWNWRLDTSMQTSETIDSSGKLEKCYGKSSNWTVNSVLRDIYDMESPREPEDQYDIAKDWKPDVGTGDLEYRKKLASGLMFIAMVNSKATTMEEYVSYLREQGFVKDKIRFDILLTLNGLDYKGRFTLDKEGNRITY